MLSDVLNINFVKKVVSNLIGTNPDFLVIEIINNYLQITLLKIDSASKKIIICQNWIRNLDNLNVPYVLEEMRKLLKLIPKKRNFSVILNLDSNLALTIYSSVSVLRQKPKELIDEIDLDNLISQAIWRFFDKQRQGVSKKLGTEEINVLLADVRIRGIKVDGHKVVNPLGFKAKSVEIYLSETLAIRDLIKGIKEMMPANKIVFVSEAGTVLSHALLNCIGDNKSLFLANIFPDKTFLFHASPGHLFCLDGFGWGGNSLLIGLYENLRIDEFNSRKIIDIYNKNTASPHLLRKLENIFMEECQYLANGIESLAPEAGKIFINPYFDLPSCLISERFESKFNKNFKIELLSTDLIMKKANFTIQFNKAVKDVKNLSTLISVLMEIFSIPTNEKINHLANRRVRWLLT